MIMHIFDQKYAGEIVELRRKIGIDVHDEVWDGVYIVSPLANNSHQDLVSYLHALLHEVIKRGGSGVVHPGANVSDRSGEDWVASYRVPDLVVVLPNSRAVNRRSHWQGGPDFLVEIERD